MTEVSNVGERAPELQLGSTTKGDKPVSQGKKGTAGNNDHFLQIEVSSVDSHDLL